VDAVDAHVGGQGADLRGQELVQRAAAYARRVHAGDLRKGSGAGYYEGHLEPVAAIVAAHGGTPVQVAAAYLHDTAEDHGGQSRLDELRTHFGDEVADIVADLSDSLVDTTGGAEKEAWRPRKERYLAALGDKPPVSLAVAAADKLHNARSILVEHAQLGDEIWSRFTTGRAEDQRWYHEEVARILGELLPDHPTVRELRAVVDQLGAQIDAAGR
jgi:(p)ppGpp synthase/HD superfamily hydrolase